MPSKRKEKPIIQFDSTPVWFSLTERAVSLLLTLSSAARRKALMFTNFRSYFTIYLSQMLLPPPSWLTSSSSPLSRPLVWTLFVWLADMNGDNQVTVTDVVLILKIMGRD